MPSMLQAFNGRQPDLQILSSRDYSPFQAAQLTGATSILNKSKSYMNNPIGS
ncbi:hypothetical protein Lferr_2500 [Acidithiobacillus ferrooxidans ATCC 53993]|nr:hypothetical protein Lferr_2500 [Acidithiobacillus ferrooxidans ATCC 53993]